MTVTVAPAAAKAEATAWPIPLVPPVTSTEVPVKSKESALRHLALHGDHDLPAVLRALEERQTITELLERQGVGDQVRDRSRRSSSSMASSKRSGYSIEPRIVNCFIRTST